ncbi:hypothetical protein SLT36_14345 [Aminobacter sp. BA135]
MRLFLLNAGVQEGGLRAVPVAAPGSATPPGITVRRQARSGM